MVSEETARLRVSKKYHKLHSSLLELVEALNVLEPGGTLLDDVKFDTKDDGSIRVAYVKTPVQVTINTPDRTLILKVMEHGDSDGTLMPKRKIMKDPVSRALS